MKSRSWMAVSLALGMAAALVGAAAMTAIYRDGNLLPRSLALLLPVAALLYVYRDFGKRVLAALVAILLVSSVTYLWLALADDLGSFTLLSIALAGLLVPIGIDLALLENGTRLAVRPALAAAALLAFVVAFPPAAALLLSREHVALVEKDQQLIREVVQHVKVQDHRIVFDHVDPKRKPELKKRIGVRSEGKTYPLSNAHFESVSRERTVRKDTERRGSSESTVVSRTRTEEMRIVVDVERKPTNIILYSTRGPLTICEQEVWLAGDEQPLS